MSRNLNILLVVAYIFLSLVLLASNSRAQSRKFTGQIFAYNPRQHIFKVSSLVQNQQTVIFRLRNRPTFVKLLFVSFGREQLDKKYLDGSATIAIRAQRDPSCDENSPKFFSQGEPPIPNERNSETNGIKELPIEQNYRIATSFTSEKVPHIEHVDCYRVETPRP